MNNADPTVESDKYRAFISYASEDRAFAARLHKKLEGFKIPYGITLSGDFTLTDRTLYPCFLDSEELRGGELSSQIKSALRSSLALIVICSRYSINSKWVNSEIEEFARARGGEDIFPVFADDSTLIADEVQQLFPVALQKQVVSGKRTQRPISRTVPLAVDMRIGRGGYKLGVMKLVAGIARIPLRNLSERHFRGERNRRLGISSAFALALGVGLFLTGENIRESASQEFRNRIDNALNQYKAWSTVYQIVSTGTDQQARMAIWLSDIKCLVYVGMCGFYTEGSGIWDSKKVETEGFISLSDIEIWSLRETLAAELNSAIAESKAGSKNSGKSLPSEIAFMKSSFGQMGSFASSSGMRYRYKFETIGEEHGKLRLAYVAAPLNSAPNIGDGELIKSMAVSVFGFWILLHWMYEFYLRRIVVRYL